MEYEIYLAFSYSRNYPESDGVLAYRVISKPPNAPNTELQSTFRIPRDGHELESHAALLKGFVKILETYKPQNGDTVNAHCNLEWFINGLNSQMYSWRQNGWKKFAVVEDNSEPEEVAYNTEWEFICSLTDKGIRFKGIKESKFENSIISDLNKEATNLKKAIMSEIEN